MLSAALSRCYEQAGWDLVTGQSGTADVQPAYPGLEDLQSAAMAVVEEIGYGREVADNVRGFVSVRIGSLRLGTAGRFLDGAHPLDFAELLNRNVVLEIEDAGDDHDKAFLMGAVLIRLIEYLRLQHRHDDISNPGLRHLTVIEEAHRLLRQPPPGAGTGPAAHSVEMFADLLAEIRAYGEGLIIAEQIPSKLIPDVVKNTAVKIAHRLPAADDRAAVGATMNLTDAQSQYLVTLPPGEAAVHTDGMDYPVLVRVPDGIGRETGPAATMPADPVIGRRSTTCGHDCCDMPCTLADTNAARRLAATEPRLVFWAELSVVAHLTGWEMPRPAPPLTARLAMIPDQLRDCALSHAVDAAVAARVPGFIGRVSPAALADHVAGAMRAVACGLEPGCTEQEPQFLAPPFKWTYVREALKQAIGGRHPDSDLWESTYGHLVPGATAVRQLQAVNRWCFKGRRDRRAVGAVVWGGCAHPVIERAVGAPADTPEWRAQLAEMLAAFATMSWPREMLNHTPVYTLTGDAGQQRK